MIPSEASARCRRLAAGLVAGQVGGFPPSKVLVTLALRRFAEDLEEDPVTMRMEESPVTMRSQEWRPESESAGDVDWEEILDGLDDVKDAVRDFTRSGVGEERIVRTLKMWSVFLEELAGIVGDAAT